MRGWGDTALGAIVGVSSHWSPRYVALSIPRAGRQSTTSSFRMGREGVRGVLPCVVLTHLRTSVGSQASCGGNSRCIPAADGEGFTLIDHHATMASYEPI